MNPDGMEEKTLTVTLRLVMFQKSRKVTLLRKLMRETSDSIREPVWHLSPVVSPQPNPDSTDWTRRAPGRNPNLVAPLLHAYVRNSILISCLNP